jgi:hypothetical protein
MWWLFQVAIGVGLAWVGTQAIIEWRDRRGPR